VSDKERAASFEVERAPRVLVTAGGGGIGHCIAGHFARAGYRVHVCDVSESALKQLNVSDPAIGTSLCDVSDADAVEHLFDEVVQRFGGLDFLINNAGIAGPTAPVEDITPTEWRQTMAVNIDGQFYCARRAVPLLKRAGGGGIVNISSVAGRLGYPMRSPYAASKWAVIGFTQSLAMELGDFNIRVNSILPGSVEGDRMARVNAARAEKLGISVDEVIRRDLSSTSLHCYIAPAHVATMALYLCSEPGSAISGQSMNVCGNVETLR
jgi:NAD(P)-dependent dehydrogenase (short-subunit alcohol dehydrogenase family)